MKWEPMKPMVWDDFPPMEPMAPLVWDDFPPMTPMQPMTPKPSSSSSSSEMPPIDWDLMDSMDDDFEPFEPMKWEPMVFKPPFSDFEGALPMPELDGGGVPVLPKTGSRLRWGLVGTCSTARDFAASLRAMGSRLAVVAAGAASQGAASRATEFARAYGIPRSHVNLEALAADATVDIVYIAVAPELQASAAQLFLRAGKHVLLERPPRLSLEQYDKLAALAAVSGKLFVLNLWTRFFPAALYAQNAVKSGGQGALLRMQGAAPPSNAATLVDMLQYVAVFLDPDGEGDYLVRTAGQLAAAGSSEFAVGIAHAGVNATFSASAVTTEFALTLFCSRGPVTISAPADAPSGAGYTICLGKAVGSASEPCAGDSAVSSGQLQQSLPTYPKSLVAGRGVQHGMGYVYIASAIERCAYTASCTELQELSVKQQRLVVRLTADVLSRLEKPAHGQVD
ncbi:hypothetical protein T492DRAFT_1082905 [Pavlovales sp. CCMP2436]|nr:hypothetical protein T492DRAFT_1082905 [Pavlovales sp. CCMP2436]